MKRRGRPLIADTPATGWINVRVTPGQRLELRRVADLSGMRVSTVIREAVNEFVADYGDRQPFRRRYLRSTKS